jgi:pimeloyl-ACP methyl ester carboxylesterase
MVGVGSLGDAGYYALSVDLPGWGKSKSWNKGPVSSKAAKSAILAILDVLSYDVAILMGKSWGGGIAIGLALDEPQRIAKLLLTAPAFGNLERLSELRQPTMLAWSEDDPVIAFKTAKVYEKSIPSIQTVYYKTGGHSAAINNANDFIPRALGFLRS